MRGLPRGFVVDSSPRRCTVLSTHCSVPKGIPRLTLLWIAAFSFLEIGWFTRDTQFIHWYANRSTGKRSNPSAIRRSNAFKEHIMPSITEIEGVINRTSFIGSRRARHQSIPCTHSHVPARLRLRKRNTFDSQRVHLVVWKHGNRV